MAGAPPASSHNAQPTFSQPRAAAKLPTRARRCWSDTARSHSSGPWASPSAGAAPSAVPPPIAAAAVRSCFAGAALCALAVARAGRRASGVAIPRRGAVGAGAMCSIRGNTVAASEGMLRWHPVAAIWTATQAHPASPPLLAGLSALCTAPHLQRVPRIPRARIMYLEIRRFPPALKCERRTQCEERLARSRRRRVPWQVGARDLRHRLAGLERAPRSAEAGPAEALA